MVSAGLQCLSDGSTQLAEDTEISRTEAPQRSLAVLLPIV